MCSGTTTQDQTRRGFRMARIHRRREADRKGTWRQALVFNSLLLVLAVLAVRILVNAYTPESVGDVADVQARDETRREIDRAFETIVPEGIPARTFWAEQIARELSTRDFSAARGYLLAAPVLLDRNDRRALLAAADAEESGSHDERLARAGLLFLPNDVRANYQRAIERPYLAMQDLDAASGSLPLAAPPADAAVAQQQETPDETHSGFSLVGDRADLVRRSQRWVNGDAIDTTQLRLSAIGLLEMRRPDSQAYYATSISILRAAGRAQRLSDAYANYLTGRVNLALPEDTTLAALRRVISTLVPASERETQVLDTYAGEINPEGLARLERDLRSIAQIASYTSPTGAVTLVELAQSPEDIRKLELVAQAGNDRAVALAKQIGPGVIDLAQIGVKWSTGLILQILALTAILIALCWTTFSALSRLRPLQRRWT